MLARLLSHPAPWRSIATFSRKPHPGAMPDRLHNAFSGPRQRRRAHLCIRAHVLADPSLRGRAAPQRCWKNTAAPCDCLKAQLALHRRRSQSRHKRTGPVAPLEKPPAIVTRQALRPSQRSPWPAARLQRRRLPPASGRLLHRRIVSRYPSYYPRLNFFRLMFFRLSPFYWSRRCSRTQPSPSMLQERQRLGCVLSGGPAPWMLAHPPRRVNG